MWSRKVRHDHLLADLISIRIVPFQGRLGDCWFLSAVAVLTEMSRISEVIITPEYNEEGIYTVRFCIQVSNDLYHLIDNICSLGLFILVFHHSIDIISRKVELIHPAKFII